MKKLIYFLCVIFIFSCTAPEKINSDPQKNLKTGWNDADTYTVKVIGRDEENARNKANHKILKDIVNVRMLNNSRYTDIVKISDEFEKPLKNGRIIRKREIDNGVEIYFQIRDKDLKKKFERE